VTEIWRLGTFSQVKMGDRSQQRVREAKQDRTGWESVQDGRGLGDSQRQKGTCAQEVVPQEAREASTGSAGRGQDPRPAGSLLL
jgi:hypothetical protein